MGASSKRKTVARKIFFKQKKIFWDIFEDNFFNFILAFPFFEFLILRDDREFILI